MNVHTHKQFDAEMEAVRSGVLTMGGNRQEQQREQYKLQNRCTSGHGGSVAGNRRTMETRLNHDAHDDTRPAIHTSNVYVSPWLKYRTLLFRPASATAS